MHSSMSVETHTSSFINYFLWFCLWGSPIRRRTTSSLYSTGCDINDIRINPIHSGLFGGSKLYQGGGLFGPPKENQLYCPGGLPNVAHTLWWFRWVYKKNILTTRIEHSHRRRNRGGGGEHWWHVPPLVCGRGGIRGHEIIAHCFMKNSAQVCISYLALIKCTLYLSVRQFIAKLNVPFLACLTSR